MLPLPSSTLSALRLAFWDALKRKRHVFDFQTLLAKKTLTHQKGTLFTKFKKSYENFRHPCALGAPPY